MAHVAGRLGREDCDQGNYLIWSNMKYLIKCCGHQELDV